MPEPTQHDLVRLGLEIDAMEHKVTLNQELQSRLDNLNIGAVVVSPEVYVPPTFRAAAGRAVVALGTSFRRMVGR